MAIVHFKHWTCNVVKRYYSNGRIALQLIQDGEPIAVATVNLPDIKLKKDEAIIKDYSENEGMLMALKNAGLIKKEIGTVQSGFVTCPVVQFNMDVI